MNAFDVLPFLLGFPTLPLIFLGVFLGIIVGAIPGLTGSMLIALTLPFTFEMSPVNAICMLIGMYVGSISGGLITATLFRMPGTPASVVTALDGYPMARGGKGNLALALGIGASFVGGMVSWVFLASLSRPLADFSIRNFGPFEIFALVMLAMVLIVSVSQGSLLKGLASGILGMFAAMPGIDPSSGQLRLTFGSTQMHGGFNMIPVLIGVFALSQILSDASEAKRTIRQVDITGNGLGISLFAWSKHKWTALRSSVIGTFIGILPGIGANVGSIVAYSFARNISKEPQTYGQGSQEGIVASESANNATVGGALVPLITMGIPGSVIDAILIGALMIHNISPGPFLFKTNPELAYGVIGSMLIANIMMFVIMVVSVRWIAKLTVVPKAALLPIILVFCVLGSFALHNRWFDVWVMVGFGVLGYALDRFRYPLGPFAIGLVLAPIAEAELRTGLMSTGGDLMPIFTRPFAMAALIVSVVLLVWQLRTEFRRSRKGTRRAEEQSVPGGD